MTQEIINQFFNSNLGQQCTELFSTSDDMVFIRQDEADFHASTLEDSTYKVWYNTNEEFYPEEYLAIEEEKYLDITLNDFQHIAAALDIARQHHLTIEVIYSAIEFAKSNQTAPIEECMSAGINEWIK